MVKMLSPGGAQSVVQGSSGASYQTDADGVVDVAQEDVAGLLGNGFSLAVFMSARASFNSPLPQDSTNIVAAVDIADGDTALTIASQPVEARKLNVKITDDGTHHVTAGTVEIAGIDQDGNEVTDSIAVAEVTTTTTKTAHAYAHVTSAATKGITGAGGTTTVGIGSGPDFGVPTCKGQCVGFALVKATKTTKVLGTSNVSADDVASTAVVDPIARTIAPTTTPAANGLVDFEFTYTYAPQP